MMLSKRPPTHRLGLVFATAFAWLGLGMLAAASAAPAMTDQAISDKVEDELLIDHAVVSTKIDLDVADGVVTLSGTVNNILAKERAAKIAAKVKGVRSVINHIQVQPSAFRSDAEIAKDIETALLEDPAADSFEVDAKVDDGMVTLTGEVQSYQERNLVMKVAKGVRGVKGVESRLDVNYGIERTDTEIKAEIEQSLRWNLYIDDHLVNVTVNDGQVTLSGTVGSVAEKNKAEWTAWVAGVESVDADKLSVEGWARDEKLRGDKYASKSAEAIRDAVNDALLLDPRVLSFNVDVDVAASTVTLRGTVDNLKAKRAAEDIARNTVGVSYVANRLKVRPENPPTDDDIEQNVEAALLRDPYVERFEVSTVVIDGVAHLYGTVDSFFDKNRADELASKVKGVVDVNNYLDVDDRTSYLYDPYVDDSYFDEEATIDYEPRAAGKTDAEIKEAIESEMWWSPFVDSTRIDVTVDNGIVTLTGVVHSWAEHRAATENAYDGGATLVDNDLVVRPTS